MKKEKLKENVRGYAQKFEDDGLRLLKKGQKGIVHAIFSRFGLVLVLLLLQVGLLFSIFRWFGNLLPHYFGGSVVVTGTPEEVAECEASYTGQYLKKMRKTLNLRYI